MVVDGAVVMVENIVRHLGLHQRLAHAVRKDSRRRTGSATPGLLCHRHYHCGVSSHLHTAIRGRKTVPSHGLDGGFALTGRHDLLHPDRARDGQPPVPQRREGMEEPGDGVARRSAIAQRYRWAIHNRGLTVGVALASCCWLALYLAFSGVIGSEFLPHLDEGAIWARGSLAPSTGPDESLRISNAGAHDSVHSPRSREVVRPDWPSRRRHRLDRLFQHRILRRPQAQRTMASGLPSGQGQAD